MVTEKYLKCFLQHLEYSLKCDIIMIRIHFGYLQFSYKDKVSKYVYFIFFNIFYAIAVIIIIINITLDKDNYNQT